jgi:signal peptidase II
LPKECSIIARSTQRASGQAAILIGSVAVIAALLLDQLSKSIILRELGPNGSRDVVTIIPSVLRLIFVRNTGSAFGMFQGSSDILKIVAVVAILLLGLYYARAAARDWVMALALGLQVGGALGNIIDRFRHGYVVDWIDFPRFPTFNIADSAITIGVILLIYVLLFRDPNLMSSDERPDGASQPRPTVNAAREDS